MLSLIAAAVLTSPGGVPEGLLSHLETGVNVTRWFCYLQKDAGADHFEHYLGDQDFAAFKKLNVRFVRLCVSPDAMYRNGDINSANIGYLDAAIDRFIRSGIAVLWDLHDNGQMKLDEVGHDNSGFISFWTAVARHYQGKYQDRLVFELLNEPQFKTNPDTWYDLQKQTVDAVRAVDPNRTIMVTSTSWSGIDTFVKMSPLPETNLIYTFHCYDPFFFTHQGAQWTGEWPRDLRRVPFPASPSAVAEILPLNDKKFWNSLENYGKAGYDDPYLHHRLQQAVNWGAANLRPVLLGEFGAYPRVSEPAARSRWFEGMRDAIGRLNLPNSLWGYDDALGLGRRVNSDGTLWLDPVTLQSFFRTSF
jgi:endoglucanase